MKKILLTTIFFFSSAFLITCHKSALANIGVGVGTGKIEVEEKLQPGLIYDIPPIIVLNTGDVPSEYGMKISYHQEQEGLRPSNDWFTFKPNRFQLDPGENQTVQIKLTLPVKMEPGEYFAFVEASPVAGDEDAGQARVGIAAASKLYFTVEPANFFQGMYYRAKSFWIGSQPYSYIIAGILLTAGFVIFIKKKFNINISVDKKWEEDAKKEDQKS